MCFVVSRRARGRGLAAALLDAAVAYAREEGATTLEAYPVDAGDGRIPAANAYHGTLSMFEKAGFQVVERRQYNATSPIRPIVRAIARIRASGPREQGCWLTHGPELRPPTSSVARPTSSSDEG